MLVHKETKAGKTKAIFRFVTDGGEVFVKVHAIQQKRPFGALGWKMTGSHCGPDGKALRSESGVKIHSTAHEIEVASDNAENVAGIFGGGLLLVAERVRNAVMHEAASAGV